MNSIEEFSERIKSIIDQHKSVSKISKVTGISESAIKKWRDGESDPTRRNLMIMSKKLSVSLLWLMTGEGSRDSDIESAHQINDKQAAHSINNKIDKELFNQVIQGFSEEREAPYAQHMEKKIDRIVNTYNAISQLPDNQHLTVIKINALVFDIGYKKEVMSTHVDTAKNNPETAEHLLRINKDIQARIDSSKAKVDELMRELKVMQS